MDLGFWGKDRDYISSYSTHPDTLIDGRKSLGNVHSRSSVYIRLARNAGYADLGRELMGRLPEPGIQLRELKRQLWWSLVIFDRPQASARRSIRLGAFTTGLPSNVDIVDLSDGKVFSPKLDEEHVEVSLLLSKCKLVVNARAAHAVDREEEAEMLLKALKENDGMMGGKYCIMRILDLMAGASSIISERKNDFFSVTDAALHVQGPYNSAMAVVDSITGAATLILKLVRAIDQAGLPARRWWGVLVHAYRACVILLLDDHCSAVVATRMNRELKNPVLRERVEGIIMVIALLREVKNVVAPAENASVLLQILLDEAMSTGHRVSRDQKKRFCFDETASPRHASSITPVSSVASSITLVSSSPSSPVRQKSKKPNIWEHIYGLAISPSALKTVKDDPDHE